MERATRDLLDELGADVVVLGVRRHELPRIPEPVTLGNMREQNAARNIDVIKTLRRFRLAEDAGRGVDVMEPELAHVWGSVTMSAR